MLLVGVAIFSYRQRKTDANSKRKPIFFSRRVSFTPETAIQELRFYQQQGFSKGKPRWWIPFGFPRKKRIPLINRHMVQSMTSPIVITQRKNAFLHINLSAQSVSSYILIRYRFTNKRHSTTIGKIGLPRLAR